MRRAAGRVDNWDELSIEQFGFRQSDFPTVGNWNQFPIPRNWWFPNIRKWFPGEWFPIFWYQQMLYHVWTLIYSSNSPISQRVFPSGGQLKHRKQLAHDKQPAAGCIATFHKYCCYTKRGGITTNLTLRNHWGYVTDVLKYHNAGKWSMD